MAQARELVEFASDPAFAVNAAGWIVAWNQSAGALLGYSAGEALGRRCGDVLRAELPGGEALCGPECRFRDCLGRRPFAVSSCVARHRDGRAIPVRISTLMAPHRIWAKQPAAGVAVIFLGTNGAADAAMRPSQQLRIHMLGHFSLVAGGRDLGVECWGRQSAVRAMKYLAAHSGTALHRDRLIDAVWSDLDAERGRERLKVTMYFIRRRFAASGVPGDLVATLDHSYMLRRESVWLDTGVFEESARRGASLLRDGRSDEALNCYREAIGLYRGDYLEEDLYADWCAEERERLREIFFDVVAGMVEIHRSRKRFGDAAQACRMALVREPCREHFHRLLMECLARSGQRDRAVAQFRRCERILATELGVAPLPETRRLFDEICRGSVASDPESHARSLR